MQRDEPAALPAGATDCHAHVFDPERFPYHPARRYTPPPATAQALRAMLQRLGLQRVICVQPSVYGTDNRCLLDALAQLGPQARGVAVIDPALPDAALAALIDGGVRGVRLNLEVGRDRDLDAAAARVRTMADRLAGTGLFLQLYAALDVVAHCAPVLAALPMHVLLDHFAMAGPSAAPGDAGFDALLGLLAHRHVFVKLSAPYHHAADGPAYASMGPLGRRFVAAAPSQVVWGSDWPHTGGANRPPDAPRDAVEPFCDEDDARLLALTRAWCSDEAQLRRLLAANPARLLGEQGGPA